MRKTLVVCLLVLLLTNSASAGVIPNDTPAPPPPAPASAVQEPMDTDQAGDMSNGVADGLAQAALDLLALLPSLL